MLQELLDEVESEINWKTYRLGLIYIWKSTRAEKNKRIQSGEY